MWYREDVVAMAELGGHDDLVLWLHNNPKIPKPTTMTGYKRLLEYGNISNIHRYILWRTKTTSSEWDSLLHLAATYGRLDVCLFINRFSKTPFASHLTKPFTYLRPYLDKELWFKFLPHQNRTSNPYWSIVSTNAAKDDNVELLVWMRRKRLPLQNIDRIIELSIRHQSKSVLLWLNNNERWSANFLQYSYECELQFFKDYVWLHIDLDKSTKVYRPFFQHLFDFIKYGKSDVVKFFMDVNEERVRRELKKYFYVNLINIRWMLTDPEGELYDFADACISATRQGTLLGFWSVLKPHIPHCLHSHLYLICLRHSRDLNHYQFFQNALDLHGDYDIQERTVVSQFGFLECLKNEDITVSRLYSHQAPQWDDHFRDDIICALECSLLQNKTYAVAEILYRWPLAFDDSFWNLYFTRTMVNSTMISIIHAAVGDRYPVRSSYMMHSRVFKYLTPHLYELVCCLAVDTIDLNVALILAEAAAGNHENYIILEHVLSKF